MAKPTKRIFISDVHLGTDQDWDWYRKSQHEQALLNMIAYARDPANGIKDLVLLGDIFETWLCPIAAAPRTIAEILDANKRVVSALQNCATDPNSPQVFYINGNHDMHVDEAALAGKLDGLHHIPQYQGGLVYAEHGSRFAMFNAPDLLHDPLRGLPLGYFITRMLTKENSYHSLGAMLRYIDDLLETAFTTRGVAECLIEALAEHTESDLDQPIAMPFGRPPTTLRDVQARYAPLFSCWVEKFGFRYVINSIRAEGGGLGWFADRLAKSTAIGSSCSATPTVKLSTPIGGVRAGASMPTRATGVPKRTNMRTLWKSTSAAVILKSRFVGWTAISLRMSSARYSNDDPRRERCAAPGRSAVRRAVGPSGERRLTATHAADAAHRGGSAQAASKPRRRPHAAGISSGASTRRTFPASTASTSLRYLLRRTSDAGPSITLIAGPGADTKTPVTGVDHQRLALIEMFGQKGSSSSSTPPCRPRQ